MYQPLMNRIEVSKSGFYTIFGAPTSAPPFSGVVRNLGCWGSQVLGIEILPFGASRGAVCWDIGAPDALRLSLTEPLYKSFHITPYRISAQASKILLRGLCVSSLCIPPEVSWKNFPGGGSHDFLARKP